MNDIAVFLIIVLLWIGFRFVFRQWLWRSAYGRNLSMRTATLLNAASFAILPLLALPWAGSTTAVVLLLVIAAGVFAFEIAIARLAVRFDKSNPTPQ